MLHLANPHGVDMTSRRRQLDLVRWMNQRRHDALGDPEIVSRIASYEMAFRMQSSVPELTATEPALLNAGAIVLSAPSSRSAPN